MKAFLGSLMCCVLVISQTFARDPHVAANGGPAYPGTSGNIAGVYAGVVMPNFGNRGCAANSLGIFSLVVPPSGLSNGTFVMFAQGRVFTGTVQAVADPEKATMKGILDATFDFTVHIDCGQPGCPALDCVDGCDVDVTASAKGKFDVDIASSSSISLGIGARLDGDVVLQIDQGQVTPENAKQAFVPIPTCKMSMNLDGFKQSSG